MAKDPELQAHLEWIGYVQPVGLVVSAPALLAAQAQVNRNIAPEHQKFLECLPRDRNGETVPEIPEFPSFAQRVFGWEPADLTTDVDALEVPLPEYHETLRPTYAVPRFQPKPGEKPWLLLVQSFPSGTNLDRTLTGGDRKWQASPQAKFERLLREIEVPIGLLFNHTHLRLVYAPRGETSGHITFSVSAMAQVAGRPIFAAMHMLLESPRLFSMAEKQRLPAILAESRRYQNTVSTQLAEQVLAALYDLVRGFQAADSAANGNLLKDVLAKDPNHVYAGLLNVLMRLVFILYAEDRGLMPSDPVYTNHYSLGGLFERLREDDGRYPDTMNQRYGAWSQLLTLFRLIYEGGSHGNLRVPAREGYLFDPDRYPFLEGRRLGTRLRDDERIQAPTVSDDVVFRVLSNLFILDGERLSYSTLDVEQIGSVYEAIMGFNLEVARGRSIAIKAAKSHGAPAAIDLDELVAVRSQDRLKWLADRTDQKLSSEAAELLKKAETVELLLAALDRKIARIVTPGVVPKGAILLQPSDERRRSGSHYTPRSLTEPIVRTTLKPILEQLGSQPTPAQILDLKLCDPAMGSGAFLVETCRQLGDELVKAWHVHGALPYIPPDEDELLHARRLVAQRCLYGVDKNPMAVDLAKLSLWLATLAKDHPFTFLDHSLRSGDSLVGLSREQIVAFHWKPGSQRVLKEDRIKGRIDRAIEFRRAILESADAMPYPLLQQKLALADEALELVRFAGDAVVAAFFSGEKDRARENHRDDYLEQFFKWFESGSPELAKPLEDSTELLKSGTKSITPFHWQIEFPEVFERSQSGFDAIVGNPPFAGKNSLLNSNRDGYLDWLQTIHEESHGNADLVAHFFRRTFNLIRPDGTFGLIATNTIAQGDTRSTGLRWICMNGGSIFTARRRYKWPGTAAVVVSVIHIRKGRGVGASELDGKPVKTITAFLFHRGGHDDPQRLIANSNKGFVGSYLLGMGFTFDDTDKSGVANSIADMHRFIAQNPRNAERIFPYIGGEEINEEPTHAFHRYVIDFFDRTLEEAEKWPDLLKIIRDRVKPDRDYQKRDALRIRWWQYAEKRPGLYRSIAGLERILVICRISNAFAFTFLPNGMIYNEKTVVFPLPSNAAFCALQARIHEVWGRFLNSSLKDDMQYTPSDCFETFPFPENFDCESRLEVAGKTYYEFRAQLMLENNEGLTKTYNRFHDPTEPSPDIKQLRYLHGAMDRAVLDAYGWIDLQPHCEFLLDYEEEDAEDDSTAFRRKKPYRYRWQDEFRDEVLARLLELNKQRAEEERLAGVEAESVPTKSGKKSSTKKTRSKEEVETPRLTGL